MQDSGFFRPASPAAASAAFMLTCVRACSTQLDGNTTLEQLSDVCGLFVTQSEAEILRTEAAAHGQRFDPAEQPHLAVLTVVGWLQALISRALCAHPGTAPVRSPAASTCSIVTLIEGSPSASWLYV